MPTIVWIYRAEYCLKMVSLGPPLYASEKQGSGRKGGNGRPQIFIMTLTVPNDGCIVDIYNNARI